MPFFQFLSEAQNPSFTPAGNVQVAFQLLVEVPSKAQQLQRLGELGVVHISSPFERCCFATSPWWKTEKLGVSLGGFPMISIEKDGKIGVSISDSEFETKFEHKCAVFVGTVPVFCFRLQLTKFGSLEKKSFLLLKTIKKYSTVSNPQKETYYFCHIFIPKSVGRRFELPSCENLWSDESSNVLR